MGHSTLRITEEQNGERITIVLEGRIAGPWAEELAHMWSASLARFEQKLLVLDLRNVTYADAAGKQVLKEMYSHAGAEFVTSTPWSQYLASEIIANQAVPEHKEGEDANHA